MHKSSFCVVKVRCTFASFRLSESAFFVDSSSASRPATFACAALLCVQEGMDADDMPDDGGGSFRLKGYVGKEICGLQLHVTPRKSNNTFSPNVGFSCLSLPKQEAVSDNAPPYLKLCLR